MKKKEAQEELERELSMRRSLYPKWIQSGSLHADTAKRQLDRMNATLSVIKAMTEDEFLELLDRYKHIGLIESGQFTLGL